VQTYGEPWSTGDNYNMGIGQGYVTATPLQVAQMGAVVANGGFLYRPSIIHHMTDEDGNIVIVDENSQVVARAHPGPNGRTILEDADGNPLVDPGLNIKFDANGNYIYQPEVIDALSVDRQYIQVIQEGMRLVNTRIDEDTYYTGATYVDWPDDFGLTTAGKTGTAEYCDNIAIDRGWCRYEDIAQRRVLPTHSWYVGYAPYENPEIVVSVFIFNGGEGSAWSAPVACNVMAAYFGLGQYADGLTAQEWQDSVKPDNRVCNSTTFNPIVDPLYPFAAEEPAAGEQ
jgi:penicillin-binding protein 2